VAVRHGDEERVVARRRRSRRGGARRDELGFKAAAYGGWEKKQIENEGLYEGSDPLAKH
jgi:hypothetical protein